MTLLQTPIDIVNETWNDIYTTVRQTAIQVYNFMQAEPGLSIFIILFSIVTLVLLYQLADWIYIHYIRKKSTEFLHNIRDKDEISVLIHSNPDPDAMATALGVERLAKEVDTEVTIHYPGWIKHHENRAFRAVLDLTFDHIESAEEIGNDYLVVVDHQEPRGFEAAETLEPDAVIDHHDSTYTGDADFVHIESNIGSCSTLLVEYMDEHGLSFKSNKSNPDISENLATGLYYGIKTDTSDFSREVSDRDYSAAKRLYQRVNTDELFKIANPKIDAETFEVKSEAFHTRDVEGPFAISHVGDVENSDTIPQAADELSRLEGISAVVVMGFDNEILRLSGRTYDSRVHMGSALEHALSGIETASAGGHSRMGGGQIDKDYFEEADLSIGDLKEDLFDALKGNY